MKTILLIILFAVGATLPDPDPVPFSPQEVMVLPKTDVTNEPPRQKSAFAMMLAAAVPPPQRYDVTLAWEPSPSTNVWFYRVHVGPTNSPGFTNAYDVWGGTSVTLSGLLMPAKFAATTIDTDGNESDFSNVVVMGVKPVQHIFVKTNDTVDSTNWSIAKTVYVGQPKAGGGFWRLDSATTNMPVEIK